MFPPVLEALVQTHGIFLHPGVEMQLARCKAQMAELRHAAEVEDRLQRGREEQEGHHD